LGVLLGGRLGYVLFYNFPAYLADPLSIVAIWQGGMSFHGGLIGPLLAGWLYCRRYKIPYMKMADVVIWGAPIGLGLGRLGNFINGELWGRQSDVPWVMVFPADPTGLARHPSQLYQFALEGVVLFAILYTIDRFKPARGVLTWAFIAFYGLFRMIVEFFREPDTQIGLFFDLISMGQILSFPMFLLGVVMMFYCWQKGVNDHVTPEEFAKMYPETDTVNEDAPFSHAQAIEGDSSDSPEVIEASHVDENASKDDKVSSS